MANEKENQDGGERMSHFDIDKYAYLKSPMHRFDPRAKILSITLLILSIALLDDIGVLLIGFLIVMIMVSFSNIPLWFVLKRMRWVALFMLAVLVILPFTVHGKAIFTMGPFVVSREGSIKAGIIIIRAFSIVLLIFPMLATMKFVTFIETLGRYGVPDKLVQMIALTYRYIFVLLNEIKRTIRSVEARGYWKRKNIAHLRTTGNMIGTLLVRSYERSEKVYGAMMSRGYSGRMKTLKRFRMKTSDWLMAALVVLVAVLLQLLDSLHIFSRGVV